MKKKLQAMLAKKEARKAELGTKANTANDVVELRGINTELEVLNSEIAELRSLIDAMPDEVEKKAAEDIGIKSINTKLESLNAEIAELRGKLDDSTKEDSKQGMDDAGDQRAQDPDQRGKSPVGKARVLGTYGVNKGDMENSRYTGDKFDTPEYRSSFMDYVLKGVRADGLEFRVDATTTTGDIGAVIPTTIMNKVIEKMKDFGEIFKRITISNVKAGIKLPVSSIKPTASWISEGLIADKQKKTISGSVVFAFYKLQIRVALTLESDLVSLPVFEQTVSDNISEAMVIGLEGAIVSGGGTGQPLGIANDTDIPVAQVLEVKAIDIGKYQTWTSIIAKMPRRYRSRAVIIMSDLDWNKYIVGMVDANGQPVARTTYGLDTVQQERFLGREVIPVEDYLPSIDDADVGDVFGIICNLSDYIINSNMQITYKRYFDENTDEWISKSTMICDGKLGDKNGVILLKKKT